jgi:integrase/recombinase XerC
MTKAQPPTVSGSVAAFRTYLEAARSRGTARAYSTGLRLFLAYLRAQDLDPDALPLPHLTPALANGYVTYVYEHLLAYAGGEPAKIRESTHHSYLFAVAMWFEWLIIETQALAWSMTDYDALKKAYTKASKVRNRGQLPPDRLPTADIVQALLDEAARPLQHAPSTPAGDVRRRELARLRNVAIVEALRSSGMRVGELVRLERSHLLHATRGAAIKYGKGGKDREVLFTAAAWDAIQTYLKARQDGASGRPLASLPVFARHDRRSGSRVLPLTVRGVEGIIQDLAARAGILEVFNLTPHTLRHWFATEFLSLTGDLALTQYALGHESPTTTRIYAQSKREDLQRAYRENFDQ